MIKLFKRTRPTWKSLLSKIKGDMEFDPWEDNKRASMIFFKVNNTIPSLLMYRKEENEYYSIMESIKGAYNLNEKHCISFVDCGDTNKRKDEVSLIVIEKDLYILFSYLSGSPVITIYYSPDSPWKILEKIKDKITVPIFKSIVYLKQG